LFENVVTFSMLAIPEKPFWRF